MLERMQDVATNLIGKFGNDCELFKEIITNPQYDPIKDEMVGGDDSITFKTKCTYSANVMRLLTEQERTVVRKVAIIPYSEEIKDLDNTWLFNNNKILQVHKTETQNGVVIFKVYIGKDNRYSES